MIDKNYFEQVYKIKCNLMENKIYSNQYGGDKNDYQVRYIREISQIFKRNLIKYGVKNVKIMILNLQFYLKKDRIIVLGDIHGDWELTIKLLKLAKVIDDNNKWIGGETYCCSSWRSDL
jgi:hypothetical protein